MPFFLQFTEPCQNESGEDVETVISTARRSRVLVFFLAIHLVLLFLLFPALFLHVEHGLFAQDIRNGPDMVDANLFSSLVNALYWSVVTPINLDLNGWPQTSTGRLLVRISDITKLFFLIVTMIFICHSLTARLLRSAGSPPRPRIVNDESSIAAVDREAETENGGTYRQRDERIKSLTRIRLRLTQNDDPAKHNGYR